MNIRLLRSSLFPSIAVLITTLFLSGCFVTTQPQLPLHSSIIKNEEAKIAQLIKNKETINKRNLEGLTPLHYAAIHGKRDVAEKLITSGADINARNFAGRTPYMLALRNQHYELANFFLEQGASLKSVHSYTNPVFDAVLTKNREMISAMLSKGGDINATNKKGITSLHLLAMQGDTTTSEFIIDQGADINKTNEDGWTPLHYAAFKNQTAAIDNLMKKGAKIINVDSDPEGAFTTAMLYEQRANNGDYSQASEFYNKAAALYQKRLEEYQSDMNAAFLRNMGRLFLLGIAANQMPTTTVPTASGGISAVPAVVSVQLEYDGDEDFEDKMNKLIKLSKKSAQRCKQKSSAI